MIPQSTRTMFDFLLGSVKICLIVCIVLTVTVQPRPTTSNSIHRHRHKHGQSLRFKFSPSDPIQCLPTPALNVTLPKNIPAPKRPLPDHFHQVSTDAKNIKLTIISIMGRYLEKRFGMGETEESLGAMTLRALPIVPEVTIDMWNEKNLKPHDAMKRSHDWLVRMTGHINVTMVHEMERYERNGFEENLTKLNRDVLHLICRLRGIVIEHDVDIKLKMATVRPIPDVTHTTKIYIDYLTLRALRDILYHTEVEFMALHRIMRDPETRPTPSAEVSLTTS